MILTRFSKVAFAAAICCSLLLAASTGFREIVQLNEDDTSLASFDAEVSAVDLVNYGQATLAGETVSAIFFGTDSPITGSKTVPGIRLIVLHRPDGQLPATITYELKTSTNSFGYDISRIQSVAGWATVSQSQANQSFELLVSLVGDPSPLYDTSFLPITEA